MSILISFRPGGAIRELRARHNEEDMSQGARRDLERYYGLLREELAKIRLTAGEAELLCAAVAAGPAIAKPRLLWAEVDEVVRAKELDKKHPQGRGLVDKLRTLGSAAGYALLDAVERYRKNSIVGPRQAALVVAGFITGEDQKDWDLPAAEAQTNTGRRRSA